jgi:acyl-CoA thioester hydrolase
MTDIFSIPIRVYYEDTDCNGIVYHANYLHFMARARSEWLRHHGYTFAQAQADKVLFSVTSLAIDYLRAAHHDDKLCVSVQLTRLGKASLEVAQEICSGDDNQIVFCKAHVKIVCTNTAMQPCALPKSFVARIKSG